MPELPEVETVCRGLRANILGARIARVVVRRADLRIPVPPDLASLATGRTIEEVVRRGKYIILHLSGDKVLICHLGMSGRIFLVREEVVPAPHDHIFFFMSNGVRVVLNDARRFGLLTSSNRMSIDYHPLLKGLGPEPLSESFDNNYLSATLRGRRTTIKAALLDQRVVAGIGNIYANEALFHANISPRRVCLSIPGVRAGRLVLAIKGVLWSAINAGGSSLKDYLQTNGEIGYFQNSWAVYGREGSACRRNGCTGQVKRLIQSGRSTFYCAKCQR